MTIYHAHPAASQHTSDEATPPNTPEVTAKQHPTYQAGAARPESQAERSVLHPEWHDPEWRYYHGAWGG